MEELRIQLRNHIEHGFGSQDYFFVISGYYNPITPSHSSNLPTFSPPSSISELSESLRWDHPNGKIAPSVSCSLPRSILPFLPTNPRFDFDLSASHLQLIAVSSLGELAVLLVFPVSRYVLL